MLQKKWNSDSISIFVKGKKEERNRIWIAQIPERLLNLEGMSLGAWSGKEILS